MRLYFDAAVELALTGKGQSQREIADTAGVSTFQVSRWHQQVLFREALADVFRHVQPIAIERAVNALLRQAEKGNLAVFNAVCDRLERWGRIATMAPAGGDPQTPAGALAIAGTHIHIHGIPEPASRTTLPPVLECPASSGAPPQPK